MIHHGDCREAMAGMEAESFHSIVTDPPYGLSFMGKGWDHGVPGVGFWTEALRVAKPGAHLLAFGGTRTHHRLMCAIEDAGWEVRDVVMWVYGSGFPKSLDVGKAIDKRRDDTAQVLQVVAWLRGVRDAAGVKNADIDAAFGFNGMAGHWCGYSQPAVPTLDQVPTLLDVLGLTLDDVPADIRELLWTLNGRKGQPGENWAKREVVGSHRAGIANPADSERHTVGGSASVEVLDTAPATDAARRWHGWGTALKPAYEPIIVARKPLVGTVAANVLEHGCGGLNIDGCRVGTEPRPLIESKSERSGNAFGDGLNGSRAAGETTTGRWPANFIHDGSDEVVGLMPEPAARFFYCAKASKADRNEGLEADTRNHHPTVKPTDLMRYLCRLVTPPGGTVLDPFCGSGSTGKAAALEGFNFVGIEQDADYIDIATARIEHARTRAGIFSEAV